MKQQDLTFFVKVNILMTHVTNMLMLLIEGNRQGQCFICFRVGHISKQCPNISLKSYFYCKKVGHHRSICPTRCERSSVSHNNDTTRES